MSVLTKQASVGDGEAPCSARNVHGGDRFTRAKIEENDLSIEPTNDTIGGNKQLRGVGGVFNRPELLKLGLFLVRLLQLALQSQGP